MYIVQKILFFSVGDTSWQSDNECVLNDWLTPVVPQSYTNPTNKSQPKHSWTFVGKKGEMPSANKEVKRLQKCKKEANINIRAAP